MRLKVEAQIRAFQKRLDVVEFQISEPAFSSSAVHNTTHKTKPQLWFMPSGRTNQGHCHIRKYFTCSATLENTSLAASSDSIGTD